MARKRSPNPPQGSEVKFLRLILKSIDPFSYLTEEDLAATVNELSKATHVKGTRLFIQGRSRVTHLYILLQGAAQYFYERNNQKTMIGYLAEKDVYGGISMLVNDGLSVRSLEVLEDSIFYLLGRESFLDLCRRYSAFSEYFTDTFGKRFLDRSYAAIISKTVRREVEDLHFFNLTVGTICNRKILFGEYGMSIKAAAEAMRVAKSSFIFIKNDGGDTIGILTEQDFTRKVIADGYDIRQPVSRIMSTPVFRISEHALIFEALMTILQNDVRHLAVEDGLGRVVGVLSQREFTVAQGYSHLFLIREISHAGKADDIVACQKQIPLLVRALIANGANARNINRFITAMTDVANKKVLDLAMQKIGPPPVPFAFIVMGSEGRREQTLKTDQDNAIVFADGSTGGREPVRNYFLTLAQKVNALLDQVGFEYCPGEIMARNPNWCQPLSVWKAYFSRWIHAAEPFDLLQASIFFDFRFAFGEKSLVDLLRSHLLESLEGWSGFLRYLTENALHYKPPLGFFRNFVVGSKGKYRHRLDIKGAMTPIVDFARVYALKNRIAETNTFERLLQLRDQRVLTQSEFDELEKGYDFLMQLRFSRQVKAILDEKTQPDNYINPKKLTQIEQMMLKEIFRRIEKFQTKMSFDFIGLA